MTDAAQSTKWRARHMKAGHDIRVQANKRRTTRRVHLLDGEHRCIRPFFVVENRAAMADGESVVVVTESEAR